ncbi:hypothetical protein [Thioalkalivibrio sp. ALE28]|uniref:DUF6932 family protein n=1 Tax=Thioalkalivibrio sp. ALE28 TaxID=1158179 RepID=UPI0012DF32F3|nr:hypothetical protein [Thioalkalivibrio sp. ALE28]
MEEEPLLEPGLHDFELGEIGNHFLEDFADSTTRPALIANLEAYAKLFLDLGASVELWLDGSFTTKKVDPNDIDLVVFSSEAEVNALPPREQSLLKALLDHATIKKRFGLDVYFCVAENQQMRSYWRGWFGFDRNEEPKGIARIMVAT